MDTDANPPMTAPAPACPTCSAPIPHGALFCLQCGSSSPTEIDATIEESMKIPRLSINIDVRMLEMQEALGENFVVKGLVGRGGFGEVWAALDVQLGRTVAVKVLRPEIGATPGYRERFRREARAIAKLRHPGIVPIYLVGQGRGLTWFVMPLVDGTTLKAILAEGRLSVEESVRVLVEAASALRDAHASGIVHRDLKPENIMLEGAERRVLIMDFGVAKMDEPLTEGLTETDTVLGSPEYMSPEQATGRALDARSDIYSLGVVAYRMFAGKLPFDAATPREVLAHHVLSPPEPLDHHVTLPGALSETIMRCLAKLPEDRWPSADELVKALNSAADRRPSSSTPIKPALTVEEIPVVRPGRPRRPMLILGVLLLILLVASPWPIMRWRQQRGFTAAANGIAGVYRATADSLRLQAARFAAGDVTARQYQAMRQDALVAAEERVDVSWGSAVEDSLLWPLAARLEMDAAARRLASTGPLALPFRLRPSDVAECRLTQSDEVVRVLDEAARDNCWWQAIPSGEMRAPLEYFVTFRVVRAAPLGSGVGLAWCRSDADCRIAFLWAEAPMVWGAHRPHSGLNTIALGRRVALTAGTHELRVRHQDGVLRVWVDGQPVLSRQASAEALYLERPSSVNLVVQNMGIELAAQSAIGGVGQR